MSKHYTKSYNKCGASASLARKITAAKKEAAKAMPERSVSVLPREARQSVGILFKMSSNFF